MTVWGEVSAPKACVSGTNVKLGSYVAPVACGGGEGMAGRRVTVGFDDRLMEDRMIWEENGGALMWHSLLIGSWEPLPPPLG